MADQTDNSYFSRNPWTADDRSLGSLRNVLFLAEKTGHLKQGEGNQETLLEDAKTKSPSLQMIALLKDIQDKRTRIHKLNLQIQDHLQDKETKDLTHLDVIEKRTVKINQLNSYLQHVISEKDQLIGRLQQPFVGESIKLDANHHKFASELFPQIVPVLSELTTELDNIEWSSQVDLKDEKLESVLSDIASTLATLQSSFQALYKTRQVSDTLYNV